MIRTPNKDSKLIKYLIGVLAAVIVIIIVISVLFATVIPLIVDYLYSSPYDYPNTKWVGEEIDMWFVFPENERAYGELIVEEKIYKVSIDRTGRSLYFDIFSSNAGGNEINIFRCYGHWQGKQQFELIIIDDFLELGYTNITLTRTDDDYVD